VSDELDKVKEYARLITVDPFETTHDDDIRLAADIVTNELRNMQQAKYPELTDDVTQLENATASIDPDILTLKQQVAVITFFRKAADLLRKMN